ncbi:MAG: nucleotidyl transferase AbiEii/AbiGii toxin family protein [Fibrobacteraceae bacterium]|nr:nucleotidyl transferase AbiEii/AbiGii toxin family protein [Fibrobacteraceae bacterium]
MNTKNLEHSIREKLLNIAKSQKTDYQVILIRYFHERFLFRLSQSKYCKHFYLKGGALFYAYEKLLARPTMDVDSTQYFRPTKKA